MFLQTDPRSPEYKFKELALMADEAESVIIGGGSRNVFQVARDRREDYPVENIPMSRSSVAPNQTENNFRTLGKRIQPDRDISLLPAARSGLVLTLANFDSHLWKEVIGVWEISAVRELTIDYDNSKMWS